MNKKCIATLFSLSPVMHSDINRMLSLDGFRWDYNKAL
jgi:hypothetical protein